jgi:hypothetical protein
MLRQDWSDLFQEADTAILGTRCARGLVIGESATRALQAGSKRQDAKQKRAGAHDPPTPDKDPHFETSLSGSEQILAFLAVVATRITA